MMRAFPFLLTSREFSIRARLLVVVLVLVQFIAPTWHVCEMSGVSCCPRQTESARPHCERPSTPAAIEAFIGATAEPHVENCLAKLLLGMPLQAAAPAETLEVSTRQTPSTPDAPPSLFPSDLPQPPSRGPPVFSL